MRGEMLGLPVLVAVLAVGVPGCGDVEADEGSEHAGQGIPCVADGTCQTACANDPDCRDGSAADTGSPEPNGDSTPGSSGAGGELSCGRGEKLCDGQCVWTDDPLYGCADPEDCTPCFVIHGDAGCDAAGLCAVTACDPPFWDCNLRIEDGCEIDRDNDPENCGECGYSCAILEPEVATHAEATCARGRCAIGVCNRGYSDCDDDRTNGCEVDLMSSREHCGACDSPCADTEDCVDGSCVAG